MKLRSVTYFVSAASYAELCAAVEGSVAFFHAAIAELAAEGVVLQMARIATNSFEDWVDVDAAKALAQLQELDARLAALERTLGNGLSVIASIGQVVERIDDGVLVGALTTTDRLFACVAMRAAPPDDEVSTHGVAPPDVAHAHACAELVLALNAATRASRGLVLSGPLAGAPYAFKMAVTCGLGAGSPFFPGAHAPPPGCSAPRLAPAGSEWRAPAFAFACENSDLLVTAFTRARALGEPGAAAGARVGAGAGGAVLRHAARELHAEFSTLVGALDAIGRRLEARCAGVAFAGTDSSVASAAEPAHSLVLAFEALGLGPFGGAGTLVVCSLVTAVLKALPYRLVGYCGLMLPQTEDTGLGALAARGGLPISALLLNSSVCGTGIDTVLVPAGASAEQIRALYCDVAAMASRLRKPLSVRVWPAPGAPRVGDPVRLSCPFFVDSAALALDPPAPGAERQRALALAAAAAALAAVAFAVGRASRK
jgi:hypothetical protein